MKEIYRIIGKCEAILKIIENWVDNQATPSKKEVITHLDYLYKQCVEARKWFDEHDAQDNDWEEYCLFFEDELEWYNLSYIETDDIEILATISRIRLLNWRTQMYYYHGDDYKKATFVKVL